MASAVAQTAAVPQASTTPTISVLKARTTSCKPSETSRIPSAPQSPLGRIAQRTPSRPSKLGNPTAGESAPTVPTPQSTSTPTQAPGLPGSDVRRSVSIAAFPQPPQVRSRIATSPKPSSSATWPTLEHSLRDSEDPGVRGILGGGSMKIKKLKTKNSSSALSTMYANSHSPTLLNGSGDGKSIVSSDGNRISDGLNSLHSPGQSRSSSAQGSYSTSATTFEDTDDVARRGRDLIEPENNASKSISTHRESKGNVIVSVRVRPDAAGNGEARSEGEWLVDGRRSLISYRGKEGGEYYYDNVFATHDRNNKVYDASTKRLVRRVMEGYHGTVFAYGMTGTGKTFSMQGTASSPGVIPLAIADIFSYIRETPHREFLLRVSYLEIYNEKIHDLLSGSGPGVSQPEEIKLREDSKRGVYASPLKEEIVQSPTQLLRVIARGDHSRRTRSTQYNAQSSRSHAVVQIVVESRERMAVGSSGNENKRAPLVPGGVRVSTLSMIDLAGSERAAESKERRTEGAHINKSLLTLGTVIARLSSEKDISGNPMDKDGKHLPYRDSKLTRLLQPALSGNSLVSILCTIQIGSTGSVATTTGPGHTGETLNTLKFAARAKNNIVSHAKKAEEAIGNGNDAGSRVLLERYRVEIQTLRQQLEGQGKAQQEHDEQKWEKEAEQRHEEQMIEMQLARTALKERIEHLNRLIISSKSSGVNNSGQLSALSMHPKLAAIGTESMSRSARSSGKSSRSSAGNSTLQRTTSTGSSATVGGQAAGQSPTSSSDHRAQEDDSSGEYGDGTATQKAQIQALQADLADKNRYISTLEKRLLQARRSSNGRTSLVSSPSMIKGNPLDEASRSMALLQEKDTEIRDLRGRLDDKDRMVTALRSALARKREVAEATSEVGTPKSGKEEQHERKGSGESIRSGDDEGKSPVELLSPHREHEAKRKSMEEMSRMLDEMIQGRVESGRGRAARGTTTRTVSERKKEWPAPSSGSGPGATSGQAVPGMGALAACLRPTSIISEGESAR
ncbi:MAG: hypothetical protein Q9178_006361 [Gyalolechia marmorata]